MISLAPGASAVFSICLPLVTGSGFQNSGFEGGGLGGLTLPLDPF